VNTLKPQLPALPHRRALLAALAFGLAGCATQREGTRPNPWTTGRLSLRVDATAQRPSQGLSAGFELRGNGDAGELRLLSPLGTRMVTAVWGSGRATLQTSEGERAFASLDELALEALGEPLPLAALPDWLAGRPWPKQPFRALQDGFEQLGWQVSTAERLEGRVAARRESPPAVQLRVRLDLPGT
jgi:outer membrane lipoprotein LolB